MYDVGVSVGAGGYNYQEDTMLVQYFLHWVAMMHVVKGDAGPGWAPLVLDVDGLVGPKTLTAIWAYQAFRHLTLDGRVDPTESTILSLNCDFFDAFPGIDSNAPHTWPVQPPLLMNALVRVALQTNPAAAVGAGDTGAS
jgi:peptidoglycan hydrolase-like protein with peptidoglycan-binding domain